MNGTYKKDRVFDMSEKAVLVLKKLFDFVSSERKLANKQRDEARETKDYRAADRHNSYAYAMQKVRARCLSYARENFLVDLSACDSHRPIDNDGAAICAICGVDLGWYCQIAPKSVCEYGTDEWCVHCGAPEERQ
jgi:hypothetical protein